MVLSLTIDPATTPEGFLTDESDRQIVLIRWDENEKKWVNEGGEVGNTTVNGQNIKFIMAEVSQFGKFTLGKIKKGNGPNQDLIIYNALSPNGDDKNEFFHIKGIDNYPDNEVEIYNRWGIRVYSTKSYNENDNVFKGYSEGRSTINPNEKLPDGTYFYVLRYVKENKNYTQTGYLYISE
ncbi:gliding motility-associated-like protein [Flavobacterium cutihirudinis]|uniref:Gliding motility-associated-like protein n=1 Tax=Flavobacterium cutihirudinis TaxID=1265740 RepID=A0A3D9FJT5_9FLAO|nr:gliding motility-associated C-terminal domain-containing protein [Flavobacterium cutihirudinis]RED19439.1 gliding motility-associated-like protein [Flavobacterium cutihirudinis]